MRILIITPTSIDHMEVGGGVAVTYHELEKQLRAAGHEVVVLSSWNRSMDSFSAYLYPKFRLCSASQRNFVTIRQEISRADRVVLSDEFLAVFIVLECIAQGVPVFYGLHTDVNALFQSYLSSKFALGVGNFCIRFLYKFVGLSGNHMFTTSVSFNAKLKNVYGVASKVINQSFKEAVFREEDPKEVVQALRDDLLGYGKYSSILLYAGRFSREKRIPLLIESKPKGSVLVVVGDGPDRDDIVDAGNGEDVRIINRMVGPSELRIFYKAADIFVSASNFETYGMTCHEALVCGTPVVVENAQGYQSQVIEGDNGRLVCFDDTACARECIGETLKDLSKYNARVTCKSGVNIVEMIVSEKNQGSYWLSILFGRFMTTFVNPLFMLSLFILQCSISTITHELRRGASKTEIFMETCVDKLV